LKLFVKETGKFIQIVKNMIHKRIYNKNLNDT